MRKACHVDDWFWFPPETGTGSDGCWWNYQLSADGKRWMPKKKAEINLTKQERDVRNQHILDRWHELSEGNPEASVIGRYRTIAEEMNMNVMTVKFVIRRRVSKEISQ